jgi:Arc/MetJ family transcription regulator
MGRTNIVLDDELVDKAKSMTGIKTIRELVHHALRELVRHKRQRDLLELQGRIDWEGDLDTMRRGRSA